MMGVTGTYAINGVDLSLQPTTGRWTPREVLEVSGEGRPIYPTVREFEIKWGLMSMNDFNQIQASFNLVQSSGTCVVDLPQYATTPYQFFSYSGCTLREPQVAEYFNTWVSNVVLVVMAIRT